MSDERIWTERFWTAVWAGASEEAGPWTPDEHAERCFRALEARIQRTLIRNYPRVSPTDIEDAVQYAFVQYWREIQSGRQIIEPFSWLTKVARNELFKRIKYESRWGLAGSGSELLHTLTDTLTDDTTVDDLLRRALQQERYSAAIDALPPFERRCFTSRLANLTLKEIGAQEGVDFRRVAEAIGRAVELVRRHINGD